MPIGKHAITIILSLMILLIMPIFCIGTAEAKMTYSTEIKLTQIDKADFKIEITYTSGEAAALRTEIDDVGRLLSESELATYSEYGEIKKNDFVTAGEKKAYEYYMTEYLKDIVNSDIDDVNLDGKKGFVTEMQFTITGSEGGTDSTTSILISTSTKVTFQDIDKNLPDHKLVFSDTSDEPGSLEVTIPSDYQIVLVSKLESRETSGNTVTGEYGAGDSVTIDLKMVAKVSGGGSDSLLNKNNLIYLGVAVVLVVVVVLGIIILAKRSKSEIVAESFKVNMPQEPQKANPDANFLDYAVQSPTYPQQPQAAPQYPSQQATGGQPTQPPIPPQAPPRYPSQPAPGQPTQPAAQFRPPPKPQ